jgi:hypothetical protein
LRSGGAQRPLQTEGGRKHCRRYSINRFYQAPSVRCGGNRAKSEVLKEKALVPTGEQESSMKKFVLLHYGFEKPTPEIMAAWGKWFEATKPHTVDMGGFGNGREISKGGTKSLPLGPDSITGFTIVNAASLDDAEKMAEGNPYISSIRVYEVRSG